jgi:hypothetical protein
LLPGRCIATQYLTLISVWTGGQEAQFRREAHGKAAQLKKSKGHWFEKNQNFLTAVLGAMALFL